jgi:hypothetical protein
VERQRPPLQWQDKCFTEHVKTGLLSTRMSWKVTIAPISLVTSRGMTFLSK